MTVPQPPQFAGLPETDVQDAARRAASGEVLLLDVREPDEWARGRAPYAVHIPLGTLDPASVPRDRPVLTVCRSGGRSGRAAEVLATAGFDVTNVAGGMQDWQAQGLPLVADTGEPTVS